MVLQADILPVRKSLHDFYLEAIQHRLFRRSRLRVLANLQPFDRQAYVSRLECLFAYIPEQFRFWILEWPAMATIGFAWPVLPRVRRVQRYSGNEIYLNLLHVDRAPSIFHAQARLQSADPEEDVGEPASVMLLSLTGKEQAGPGDDVVRLSIDTHPLVKDRVFYVHSGETRFVFPEGSPERGRTSMVFGTVCSTWIDGLRLSLDSEVPRV